jgi:hypothetical protein
MAASDYDTELDELANRSVGRLLCAEVFDESAFSRLHEYIRSKSEDVRSEHVISKQLVACLLNAAASIENSATHVPTAKANLSLAAEFRRVLHVLAIGEAVDDRLPGVPRVL